MQRELITISDYKIDCRAILNGHSRTIVFVHGIGVAADYFLPLARLLSTSYNVILPDLPGYGTSPKPDHALTIDELAAAVEEVLDYYSLDSSVLVGHSMGCQIVASVIRNAPSRADKAILISPSTNNQERTISQQSFRLMEDIFHETLKMNLITLNDYFHMGIARFLKTAGFMVSDKIEENITGIDIPLLFIRGGSDRIVPQRWIEYLVGISKDARLVVHENTPHNLHYSYAEVLAKDMKEFIG